MVDYLGEDKEYLVLFAKENQRNARYRLFYFRHRHIMLDLPIAEQSRDSSGRLIRYFSYAVFDGNDVTLKTFSDE